jgi:beta-lactamase class D
LVGRIGGKKYNKYLKAYEYFNKAISGVLTLFCLGKRLKISLKNQIEFLRKL